MIPLPNFLKTFLPETQQYFEKGLVKDIEFSGGTYQVQIIDAKTKDEVWAFLQLDQRGKIKDSFCSCEEGEDIHHCVHQAVAFLRIYHGHPSPLHQRFERSLWNCLCQIYADKLGYHTNSLKQQGKGYYASFSGGKPVFYLKGLTPEGKARLEEMISHRRKETEETSLKFSNLSQEEIMQWREGRPNAQLRYELSFWNDLAKWFMIMQDENAKYEIQFGFSPKKIPNQIEIHFSNLDAFFQISETDLSAIIPTLATVDSPLVIHHAPEEEIEKITYDKEKGLLQIIHKSASTDRQQEKKQSLAEEGIEIEGWTYVKNDGFYSRDRHFLLSTSELSGKQIEQALNEYHKVIKNLMEGSQVHEDPVQVSYAISFDKEWNLHLSCYMFTPGDLNMGNTRRFGKWVYLDNEGFYRLEGIQFDQEEIVIPSKEVSKFVTQNRTLLNLQEGFRTHLANIEANLTYHLSQDNHLTFSRSLTIPGENSESKDFGEWIYIIGQGFFAKITTKTSLPLHSGITIYGDQIPVFIRTNQEELQLVKGFFSEKCPIEKSRLSIHLVSKNQIQVNPEYELYPEYQEKFVRFFDDYIYVEGEGFHELPVELRLPENYRQPVLIKSSHLDVFLDFELDTLKPFIKEIDPGLLKPKTTQLISELIVKIDSKEKLGYGLKLKYETDKGSVFLSPLWDAFQHKERFVFTDAGLIDLDDKRFNWLKQLNKNQINRKNHQVTLSTLELLRLHALEQISIKSDKKSEATESKDLLEELTEFRVSETPDLTGLESHLRPYQEIGVHWLWFLYQHRLSGLLCDDMGLGKTHQAMALVAAVMNNLKKNHQDKKRHFLVICPTSVIYHWQEKLHDFFPNARVWTFYGTNRSLETFYENCDILLTSYGIWRNEVEQLKKLYFEVAIFDEIQIAKNYQSRIHSTLLNINAGMRLGLTGTPIENRIRELKSLFDLVLPTYMPGETEYRDFFVRPIEKGEDPDRKKLLSRLIKPFVMRRKKEDVLLDLPEKTEEISHCDLIGEQRELYIEVLKSSRQKIIAALEDENNPIPYIHVFALLSHLKQICDHPAVYLKKASSYKNYQSGKWELFVELLNEARESQQKVVVFSQYLNMLDIIQEHLNELGIGFATIRGSTINRGEQIQRFNHDPECEVFVASLQAAGLGVDLTAGSVVIHYDRWWNAARENQATDRVHRIGQTRGVQVFKLVTKDTVEEHIDTLISKKGKLMEEVVGIDDHQILKKFDRKEIIQLLQMIPPG